MSQIGCNHFIKEFSIPMFKKNNYKHKSRRSNALIMVNPAKNSFSRHHDIVAPVFRTACGISFAGTLPSSSSNRGYFLVSGNSLHIPFASTLAVANQTVNTLGVTALAGEAYNTVQPQGFSSICSASAVYGAYRVISARIIVEFQPISAADSMYVCISTVINGENPNTTLWTASEAPNASNVKLYIAYSPGKPLSKTCTSARAYGVKEAAIQDVPAYGAFYNSSPSSEWCFVVNYQTVTGSATAGVTGFNVRVEYQCEFFQPNTGGLVDTLSKKRDVNSSDSSSKSSSLSEIGKNKVKVVDVGVDEEHDLIMLDGEFYRKIMPN